MSARWALVAVASMFALACAREAIPRDGDGLDVSGQSQQFREDYAVFANRCSKCHGLVRPLHLASQQTSDEYWERYVERMRRQPGSGISPEDGVAVRRFLHVYSRLSRREQNGGVPAPPPEPPSTAAATPPQSPPPPPPAIGAPPPDAAIADGGEPASTGGER